MKDFMRMYKAVVFISAAVCDSVSSSVAWSGAARFANNTKTDYANDELYLWLASFASQVKNPQLVPSVNDVLELVLTKPEKAQLSIIDIERFEATGMDKDSITRVNNENYARDLKRYSFISRRVSTFKDHITSNLQTAFNADSITSYTKTTDSIVEQGLIDKINTKLRARRGLLFDLVLNGTVSDAETAELKKINLFIGNSEAKAA